MVEYVFKTIKRGRVSYDEGVLILPRARNELTSRGMPLELAEGDRLVPIHGPADFYRVKRIRPPPCSSLTKNRLS